MTDHILFWAPNVSPYSDKDKLRTIRDIFPNFDPTEKMVLFEAMTACEEYAQRDLMLGQSLYIEFSQKLLMLRNDVQRRRRLMEDVLEETSRRIMIMDN